MKVLEKSAGYSISVGKDNPYVVGIGFLVAGGIMALILGFLVCLGLGIIQMTEDQVLTLVSLFSGGLTLALILCFTLPIFHRAANADKVPGKIVDIETYMHTNNGRRYESYSPVVEYDYEGQHYKRELDSSSTKRPEIGNEINLKLYRKNPNKIVTTKDVVFCAFMTVVFSVMGVIFAIPGILNLTGNGSLMNWDTAESSTVGGGGIDGPAFLILLGFTILFTLIGVIICVVVKKGKGKKNLIETGIKKEYLITGVSINTNVEINGENPVVITCYCEGSSLTLKTKTHSLKCKFHEGDKINVYFDPENEKKYAADFGDE